MEITNSNDVEIILDEELSEIDSDPSLSPEISDLDEIDECGMWQVEEVNKQLEKLDYIFIVENLENDLFKICTFQLTTNTIHETQEILLNIQDEPAKEIKDKKYTIKLIIY
ncbi:hypothetical protein Glove_585g42 [Diversispora epigaea]|uniref:Uncharacterized protein n=1 Tax=Diversispora epigaea TaxID=1348612 RepID=A0A397G8I3_9GLOM|nr:hypothetical protein Glove_585g42 [Diversispora epigaea]